MKLSACLFSIWLHISPFLKLPTWNWVCLHLYLAIVVLWLANWDHSLLVMKQGWLNNLTWKTDLASKIWKKKFQLILPIIKLNLVNIYIVKTEPLWIKSFLFLKHFEVFFYFLLFSLSIYIFLFFLYLHAVRSMHSVTSIIIHLNKF